MPQVLSKGGRGPAVRELQGNLSRRGQRIKVDGIFGVETERAVRAFQSGAGIPSDGIVGQRTWAKLHGVAATARRSPERPAPADWSFERMLRDVGAWVEDHSPFGNGTGGPAPAPVRRAPAAATPTRDVPRPSAPRGGGGGAARTPAVTMGAEGGKFRRVSFDGYEGRGWVLKNFTDMRGKQVRELGGGRFAVNPVGGARWGLNECVHLVKYFGVPYTGDWRRGPQVCDMAPGTLPVGTVIATLRDNKYHSDYSGRSHVGIYLGHDDHQEFLATNSATTGVRMLNQWNGALVQMSTQRYSVIADQVGKKSKKAWTDGDGRRRTNRVSWTKDGEEYYVVMTK
jgi:hypothetical protein